MANSKIDENGRQTLTAVSLVDGESIVQLWADPVTHRLLVDATSSSPLTHKGDIYVFSTTNTRLPVGSNGQVLSADSTTTTGLKWIAVAGTGTVTDVAALTLGTTGTDLSSTVANSTTTPVITLNVPTASATNRGALSAADWSTFNAKQAALTNPLTGTGTANEIAYFPTTSTIGSLATATYPSLTEISYVKGVTSAIQTQIGNLVAKATYDAHTVLYATTDNTPVALTVGEQTLVGRATGGNISAIAIDSDLSSVSANDDTVPSAKATKAMGDAKALLAGSTGQSFSASTLDIGNADTTLARVSAGVISVEGITIPTISSTSTFTNKRINPRLVTAASYTTDTGTSLDVAACDQFEVTAQAGALKFNNPSGTPTGGQKLIIRIKDDGTARALTYDTYFRALGNALPSTTVLGKTLYMGFIFNATDTKWDLVASAQEA